MRISADVGKAFSWKTQLEGPWYIDTKHLVHSRVLQSTQRAKSLKRPVTQNPYLGRQMSQLAPRLKTAPIKGSCAECGICAACKFMFRCLLLLQSLSSCQIGLNN